MYRLWSFRTSPFAAKARVAFAEKGVEAELVEIHPRHRPARLRELNPIGKVPVVEVVGAGVSIPESSVICEWLEDRYPDPSLWPADPDLRGWARAQMAAIDTGLTLDFFLGLRKLAFGKSPGDPDDVVERMHARLPGHYEVLESALGQHPGTWLTGEDVSWADLAALPAAVRLPEWGPHLQPDAGRFPLVTAWLEALRARPSAAAVDARGERFEEQPAL
jgi:glutathione S-transferase